MAMARRTLLAGGGVALLLAGRSFAESAAELVARECALAAGAGKRVLLEFYADWCTWCIPMEAMLTDPDASALLDAHFHIVRLRARERDEAARALQLDGADEVLARYARPNDGLPFLAVLDGDANAVTTSVSTIDGVNFGFPVTDDELAGFEAMLEIAAPEMPAADRRALRDACVQALESLRT